MQSNDDDYEEISIGSFFNEDNPGESSEYSEQTIDEEEYELYMNTINIHQIQDFEEWRNSEHFPLHLFDCQSRTDILLGSMLRLRLQICRWFGKLFG